MTSKTPEDRSEIIEKANAKAKKGYKRNLKKRTNVSPEELVVIKDMLVSLKLVGYTNTQCAAIVGLSKGQTKEVVNDPNFKSRLASLQKKLPEAAINLGRAYLVEGVQAVVHVMRTEKDNGLVLKAAAELFDRFGIPKNTRAEIKTDPAAGQTEGEIPKDVMERIRLAPPELQEQIAGLNESFREGVERILDGGNRGSDPN